jgi:hypothetical protein
MRIRVSLIALEASSTLRTEDVTYSSDEALGEASGELVAWARKNGYPAQEVGLTVTFLEPFPQALETPVGT